MLIATPVGKDSMEIHFIHRITEYPAAPGVPATVAGQVLGLMGDIDSDSKLASWVRLPDALFERVTSKVQVSNMDVFEQALIDADGACIPVIDDMDPDSEPLPNGGKLVRGLVLPRAMLRAARFARDVFTLLEAWEYFFKPLYSMGPDSANYQEAFNWIRGVSTMGPGSTRATEALPVYTLSVDAGTYGPTDRRLITQKVKQWTQMDLPGLYSSTTPAPAPAPAT